MIVVNKNSKPSLRRLWEASLGDRLADWSDATEPKLLKSFNDDGEKLNRIRDEVETDMEEMGMLSGEGREMKLDRCIQRLTAITNIEEKRVNSYLKLCGGGAAAIWHAMTKAIPQREEGNTERNATPPKRFGQVVDT